MFKNKKIKFVLPHARYIKSYLEASREFKKDNKTGKSFFVTRISDMERLAFNAGLIDFHRKIVVPSLEPKTMDKISFVYWALINDEYVGEVYIRDKILDKSSIKSIATPQDRWKNLYNDNTDRSTTLSMIIRPSARSQENICIITCLIFDKLKELGFNEFVMNCCKTDKCLSYKIYQMTCLCGGKYNETAKTIEYVIPVKPEVMKHVIRNKFLQDAISVSKSLSHLIQGLKDNLIEDIDFIEDSLIIESTKEIMSELGLQGTQTYQ